MTLTLTRTSRLEDATEGVLYVDGERFCDTLEPTERLLLSASDKVSGKTAIPKGTYRIMWTHSNSLGRKAPKLADVAYFDGIFIHAGNSAADTKGCLLVGVKDRDGHLCGSRIMQNKLYGLIAKCVTQGEICKIIIQ